MRNEIMWRKKAKTLKRTQSEKTLETFILWFSELVLPNDSLNCIKDILSSHYNTQSIH